MAYPVSNAMTSAAKPTLSNTCVILVTYHPDNQFSQRVAAVLTQFPRLFIIDNGSSDEALQMLKQMATSDKIHLLANRTNLGIAEALNQGMAVALQEGFEWAVSLDQDTQVYPDLLHTLLAVHDDCGRSIVLIGGNYHNVNKQKNFVDCGDHVTYLERKTLITSGTLMPLGFSTLIGGFRADYFIDSVDHEFCLRARANGCQVLISCKPVMSQYIGSDVQSRSWFYRFASFNHAPVRKYYIARNTLVTARDYFLREPVWSARQVWRLASDFASIVLFESNKMRKSRAFFTGLYDGLRNKMGAFDMVKADSRGQKQ